MRVIFVNIPIDSLEKVSEAMFKAGAGQIGAYDQCCFITEGIGQFRPLANSNPYLGNKHEINKVKEYKLETVCSDQHYDSVVQAMIDAHPYEQPYWYSLKHV